MKTLSVWWGIPGYPFENRENTECFVGVKYENGTTLKQNHHLGPRSVFSPLPPPPLRPEVVKTLSVSKGRLLRVAAGESGGFA